MPEGTIHTRDDGAVRIISIERPEKKNALTAAMYVELNAALDAAAGDAKVRALLITGTQGVFTAGNDLADFLHAPPDNEDAPVIQLLYRLAGLEKPLIAAVDGPAVGIGTTLLLHCDDVLATARAKFMLPFVNLGLVPEAGSSLLLPMQVGMRRASRWLLCGEPFDGKAALEAGLINELVEPDQLLAAALARARVYAARPQEALLAAKWLIRGHHREQVRETIRAEVKIFAERLRSQECKSALSAFLEKKK